MFKQTATDLTTLSPETVKTWLDSFDTVLSDLDGVHYLGKALLPGSLDVTKQLQEMGKDVYFVTNAPVSTRTEIQAFAQSKGYNIDLDHVFSVSYVIANYLQKKKFNKKVYLCGTFGISKELEAHGIQYIDADADTNRSLDMYSILSDGIELEKDIGAVFVGFDHKFDYKKLLEASNYLKDPNCLFIGTGLDELYPSKKTVLPASGPLIRAVETATSRKATIFGKPSVQICQSLLDEGKIDPKRTLMIGDTLNSDILLGTNCGFQTLFVGSGVHSYDDILTYQKSNLVHHKNSIPDVYLPKLGDLLPFFK